jgi:hypothetical protein
VIRARNTLKIPRCPPRGWTFYAALKSHHSAGHSPNQLVRTLTDPQLYLKRVAHFKGDARLYQERSRRVRNALAHGNPVSQSALTSARVWWEFVADLATHVATEGYGQSPSNTVRTMQRLRERFAAKLASGTPPVEAYG